MSAEEALITGTFRLVGTILSFAFLYWFIVKGGVPIMKAMMSGAEGWGELRTTYSPVDPRRLWCKHHVSSYCRGPNGLWAVWCGDCGHKLDGR